MRIGSPSADADPAFTLDDAASQRRRMAAQRRLHVLQIPAMRAAGFALLCAILALHDARLGRVADPELLRLVGLDAAYVVLGWAALWRWHGRTGRLDLSLALLHLDLPMWLLNLQHLQPPAALVAAVLLARVADQVGFGLRRALYFNHLAVAAYLAHAAWQAPGADAPPWGERLEVAAFMYLVGLYVCLTGLVTQQLREQARRAIQAARGLIRRLDSQTQELQAQARALEQARAAAEQASHAKSRFLAAISHELRTPLNGVMGPLQLLQHNAGLSPTQQHYTQVALDSAHRLVTLIDELLDVAAIADGTLRLQPQATDLGVLAAALVRELQAPARAKGLQLSCDCDPALAQPLLVDARRLRQVLFHLLDNALKFTEHGEVRLQLRQLRMQAGMAELRIDVRDTGCGMAPEALARVFEPFERGDASSTRRHGGSGLGLAIVKQTVALMGGRIDVHTAPGQGCQMTLRLSLPRAT